MKPKNVLLLIAVGLISNGCAGFQRPATDAALGAGGGYIASELSHGNPAITAGGAVAGIAVGEGLNVLKTRGQQNAYADGYNRGRADRVKAVYWNLVEQQRDPLSNK